MAGAVLARRGWRVARSAARQWVGDRPRPAPWNSRIIDDLADNRPWNLMVKALRVSARTRLSRLEAGATVVVVNWDSAWLLRRVMPRVISTCPPTVPILVVDNGSRDDSVGYLKLLVPRVRTLRLPVNVGHALALDIATLRVGTGVVVALDSDAFPIRQDWLDVVVRPVADGRVAAAGLRASRGFVHPAFLALDVRTFVLERLSFQPHQIEGGGGAGRRWGVDCWDTGELLSRRLGPDRLAFLDVARNPLGLGGVSTGGVVYHHGAMSRAPDRASVPIDAAGFDRAMALLGLSPGTDRLNPVQAEYITDRVRRPGR